MAKNDNLQIKDGLGNLVEFRARDVSTAQDGSIMRSMMLDSLYPIDYGQGGMFQFCAKSGVIAAGIANNSPIFSFYWAGNSAQIPFALIRRVRLNAWCVVAFTTGTVTFDMFAARQFSVPDSGGNLANMNRTNMLNTAMASSLAIINWSNTAALTPGTRVLDLAPLDTQTVPAPQVANAPFTTQRMTLFEKLQGEHPLLLQASEGFVVRVTVPPPGIGTWQFALTAEWDEVSSF
jgi:hypothetical protein